jgi:multidrug efflux pump subunit AcrA (membrane-fusion protein)
MKEPATVFVPGQEPKVVAYEDLPRPGPLPPESRDRGSRAETVTYGGGLRQTSRRVAAVSVLATVLAAALGFTIYLVNAQDLNRYSAAVVPANVVPLNFQETAPLKAIYVSPGERVHKGQLLAAEQDQTLALEIEEQRLVVSAARERLRFLGVMASHLGRRKLVAEQLVLARDSLAIALAGLAVDRSRLVATEIRSPMDGTVVHVAGVPGELVGPSGVRSWGLSNPDLPVPSVFRLFPGASGASTNLAELSEPVVTLVTGRRWQVVAAVPEATAASLVRGEPARFIFAAMGGRSVPARLEQVVGVPFLLGGQVNYEVVLRLLERLPRGVLPGMSGTVSFS